MEDDFLESDPAQDYDDYDILGQFQTVKQLGTGSFGPILEVNWKYNVGRTYAMKIMDPMHLEVVGKEQAIYERLKKLDPRNEKINFVNWILPYSSDDYKTYILLEKLGESLDQFQLYDGAYTVGNIRTIGSQLLHALEFLHGLEIIHRDLKSSNVFLVDSDSSYRLGEDLFLMSTAVRLVDFGMVLDTNAHNDYNPHEQVQDKIYRAPEVTLQIGYAKPIDIWSLGCCLFGLYVAQDLLDASDTPTFNLGVFEHVLGKFPDSVRQGSPLKEELFDENGLVMLSEGDRARINAWHPLDKYFEKDQTYLSKLFLDLLKLMLQTDPNVRISARDALKHPFFSYYTNTLIQDLM